MRRSPGAGPLGGSRFGQRNVSSPSTSSGSAPQGSPTHSTKGERSRTKCAGFPVVTKQVAPQVQHRGTCRGRKQLHESDKPLPSLQGPREPHGGARPGAESKGLAPHQAVNVHHPGLRWEDTSLLPTAQKAQEPHRLLQVLHRFSVKTQCFSRTPAMWSSRCYSSSEPRESGEPPLVPAQTLALRPQEVQKQRRGPMYLSVFPKACILHDYV